MNPDRRIDPSLTRRHLFRLGGGVVIVTALGACSSGSSTSSSTLSSAPTAAGPDSEPITTGTDGPSLTSTSPPVTSTPATVDLQRRRLVIVQLNGGNDALNMVVPVDGRYQDVRPTIAIAEADLFALDGLSDVGLHPGLAALAPLWNDDRLAIVRGIGFERPNRSHFVAMDRWWRADEPTSPGWLGRVLDGLAADPTPLAATALGGGAPLLVGAVRSPTTILSAEAFTFAGVDPALVRRLADPESVEPLVAMAQRSLARSVDAVTDFAALLAATQTAEDDDAPTREGDATLAAGLRTAAALLVADPESQIVVVSASGFDTHANEIATHGSLMADLAEGIAAFFELVDDAGIGDDVLVATTSEFGRRVAENGSAGTDHGAGSSTLVFGTGVAAGVHGEIDLGDLLDGDVRPVVDPRVLYTACLDWIGADPAAILGRRYDDLSLLRP